MRPRWIPHIIVCESEHGKSAVERLLRSLPEKRSLGLVSCQADVAAVEAAFERMRSVQFANQLHAAGWDIDGVEMLHFIHLRDLPCGKVEAIEPHPSVTELRQHGIVIHSTELFFALDENDAAYGASLGALANPGGDSRRFLITRHSSSGNVYDSPHAASEITAVWLRLALLGRRPVNQDVGAAPLAEQLLIGGTSGTVSLLGLSQLSFPTREELAMHLASGLVRHARRHMEGGIRETTSLRSQLDELFGTFRNEVQVVLRRSSSIESAHEELEGVRMHLEAGLREAIGEALGARDGKHIQLGEVVRLLAERVQRLEQVQASIVEPPREEEPRPCWLLRLFGRRNQRVPEPAPALAPIARQVVEETRLRRRIWLEEEPEASLPKAQEAQRPFDFEMHPTGAKLLLHEVSQDHLESMLAVDLFAGAQAIAKRVAENLAAGRARFEGADREALGLLRQRLTGLERPVPALLFELLPELMGDASKYLGRTALTARPLAGMAPQRKVIWFASRPVEVFGSPLQAELGEVARHLQAEKSNLLAEDFLDETELGILVLAENVLPTALQPFANLMEAA